MFHSCWNTFGTCKSMRCRNWALHAQREVHGKLYGHTFDGVDKSCHQTLSVSTVICCIQIFLGRLFWQEVGLCKLSYHFNWCVPCSVVPRFRTLIFFQEALIPSVPRLSENVTVLLLLTTDHKVSWTITAPKFSTLDYTRFTAWIASWRRSQKGEPDKCHWWVWRARYDLNGGHKAGMKFAGWIGDRA